MNCSYFYEILNIILRTVTFLNVSFKFCINFNSLRINVTLKKCKTWSETILRKRFINIIWTNKSKEKIQLVPVKWVPVIKAGINVHYSGSEVLKCYYTIAVQYTEYCIIISLGNIIDDTKWNGGKPYGVDFTVTYYSKCSSCWRIKKILKFAT